jgi:hypothetical protein
MPIFMNFCSYNACSFIVNKQPQKIQGHIPENEDDLLSQTFVTNRHNIDSILCFNIF